MGIQPCCPQKSTRRRQLNRQDVALWHKVLIFDISLFLWPFFHPVTQQDPSSLHCVLLWPPGLTNWSSLYLSTLFAGLRECRSTFNIYQRPVCRLCPRRECLCLCVRVGKVLMFTGGGQPPTGAYLPVYESAVCMKFCPDRTEECKLFRRQLSFVVLWVTAWFGLIAVSQRNFLFPLHQTPFHIHWVHWHLLNGHHVENEGVCVDVFQEALIPWS